MLCACAVCAVAHIAAMTAKITTLRHFDVPPFGLKILLIVLQFFCFIVDLFLFFSISFLRCKYATYARNL
jgi:hypothetical protein